MTKERRTVEMILIVLAVLVCGSFAFENSQVVKNRRLSKHSLAHLDWDDRKNVLEERTDGTGCSCVGYECGCCAHLNVPKIKLNDTGCVNITYLPSPDYGISLSFSLDGKIYYNYTVSARNPPPLCFGIPHLEKYASICIKFYDLNVSNYSLSGCIMIEAKLAGVEVEKIDLGCFKIPPTDLDETLRYIPRSEFKRGNSFSGMDGALRKIMLKLHRYHGHRVPNL